MYSPFRSTPLVLVAMLVFIASCDEGGGGNPQKKFPDDGKVHHFALEEVTLLSSTIAQPAGNGGTGTIDVVLPYGTADLTLTPVEENFNMEAFTVSPAPGTAQDFSGPVIYTVTSKEDAGLSVKYKVTMTVSDDPETGVSLTLARMYDFDFEEVDVIGSLQKTHPVLEEGVETEPGVISLLLPEGTTDLNLTPLVSNFEVEGFSISPALGEQTDFSGPVTYTIQANNTDRAVHYTVSVEVLAGEPEVTAFRFEKANNPGLPGDIEAAHFISGNERDRIYVFVPLGTDFSSLHATVEYNGASLEYRQSGENFQAYPEEGMNIDYKYPQRIMFRAKNPHTSIKQKDYEVLVDVIDPIKFESVEVDVGDYARGSGSMSVDATKVINQGNHAWQASKIAGTPINLPAFITYPFSGDLPPGESALLQVSLNLGVSSDLGDYETVLEYKPLIRMDRVPFPEDTPLFESSSLTVKFTIVDP